MTTSCCVEGGLELPRRWSLQSCADLLATLMPLDDIPDRRTNMTGKLSTGLHEQEIKLLSHLRAARPGRTKTESKFSLGDRIADRVAATMGSWTFIIIQSVLLAIWIALNVTAFIRQWDPYPFILLNLALSFQAAYAAPVIMMSQNRQAALDRADAATDYQINAKAELEIELLHQKIDLLRETELLELVQVIRRLEARLPAVPFSSTPG